MDDPDPKGLIGEAYRIQGIGETECRSIFLDWALGAPADPRETIGTLLARHGESEPDHPMTAVLREALMPPPRPARRGGWRGRR